MWLTLALVAAFCQVVRNTAMKRLGHALDEYINVWGRFSFLLPFALIACFLRGWPPLAPGFFGMTLSSYVEAVKKVEILFAMVIGIVAFGEARRVRESALGAVVMLVGMVLLTLAT